MQAERRLYAEKRRVCEAWRLGAMRDDLSREIKKIGSGGREIAPWQSEAGGSQEGCGVADLPGG